MICQRSRGSHRRSEILALPARTKYSQAVIIILYTCALFISPGYALANEGPHGGYSLRTVKCAICHRPHTGKTEWLLRGEGVTDAGGNGFDNDISDFCFSCHKDGAGANNNVYGGYFMGYAGPGDGGSTADVASNPWIGEPTNTSNLGTKNAGLNGGGFVTAKPYFGSPYKLTYNGRTERGVDWVDPAGGTHFDHASSDPLPVTSSHNVLDDTKNWTVWGSIGWPFDGGAEDGPGMTVMITCNGCHDQHGSNNYRILRDSDSSDCFFFGCINYLLGYNWAAQPDEFGAGAYGYPDKTKPIQSWEQEFVAGGLTKDYTSYSYKYNTTGDVTISDFCKSCHSQYYNANSPSLQSYASYESGDELGAVMRFRHYTEATFDTAPGGCISGTNCAAENLNKWVQLPFASRGNVTLGKRGGLPIYQASVDPANDYIVCTTCHQAHGTTSFVTASARVGPTKNAQGSDPGHSNLLRLDNRGVCEDCHGWTPAKDENGEPCTNNYGSDDITNCAAPIGP